jgi:hypothetical protein
MNAGWNPGLVNHSILWSYFVCTTVISCWSGRRVIDTPVLRNRCTKPQQERTICACIKDFLQTSGAGKRLTAKGFLSGPSVSLTRTYAVCHRLSCSLKLSAQKTHPSSDCDVSMLNHFTLRKDRSPYPLVSILTGDCTSLQTSQRSTDILKKMIIIGNAIWFTV